MTAAAHFALARALRLDELREDARQEMARARGLATDYSKRGQAIDAARASLASLALASDHAAARALERGR